MPPPSTEAQANQGLSLKSQEQQLAVYVLMKSWKIEETFVERGISGGTPLANRPEGKRLLAAPATSLCPQGWIAPSAMPTMP